MEDYNNQINLDDLGDWKLLHTDNLRILMGGLGFSNGQNVSHLIKSLKYLFPYQYQIWRKHAIGISDMTGIYIPLNIKNFYILSPCFSKYDNLYHYILESAKTNHRCSFLLMALHVTAKE